MSAEIFQSERPDAVINTIGLTNLELCEKDPLLARRTNVETVANVAKACGKLGSRLIHISTDHLFDGKKSFYDETDIPAPLNQYGKTKLEGEKRCLGIYPEAAVIRTNFYGWSYDSHPPTFAEWLYQSLFEKKPIRLYTDYYFSSIEVGFLCEALESIMLTNFKGILNVVSPERFSKADFGLAMAKQFSFKTDQVTLCTITPEAFSVRRQSDLSMSVKRCEDLIGRKLPGLIDGLTRFRESVPV